ncbi:MAG: lipocalin family protein [Salegentibacter sp.]
MKKFSPRFFTLIFIVSAFAVSCEPENAVMQAEAIQEVNVVTPIDYNSLIGEWKVSKMESDTLVDLNGDGVWNTNILAETDCFQNMGVTFNSDGTTTTTNAKLDFTLGPNGDEFGCIAGRTDAGTWSVENDELVMNLNIDGVVYTDRKQIVQTATTFSMDITKFESDQYVNDPGNSQASQIRILSVEYTKIN